MREFSSLARALATASIAFAMLPGCSGNSLQAAPDSLGQIASGAQGATTGSLLTASAKPKPLIFVSDERHNNVDIFLQSGGNHVVGRISGIYEPLRVATDRANNVYIADGNGNVSVFAPPYTGPPSLVLSGGYAFGVAVSKNRLVAAVGYPQGVPSVTFFAKGASTPCATVTSPGFSIMNSDAFDGQGNLYIEGRDPSNQTEIGEVTGGCNATAITPLTTANALIYSDGGIQVDKQGRIAILTDNSASSFVIYTYNPPVSGSLGNPVSTTILSHQKGPFGFAFLASGAGVYVAGFLESTVKEYAYPGGGVAIRKLRIHGFRGLPSDVAVTPPLVP
ncbi:MAG: hypothetical protein JOZ77_08530 [Candidatus Eremiobacteraeota bacterium]|nr:hypothetical protein [Candidatus Eremiobacteraeota bacterium]